MKYFILFKSGRLASAVKIQSNHPYENNKYSYMVDDMEYCYVNRTYTCETADYYKQGISYTLPSFYSYRPEYGCWFVDRDIKCIIAIDEKEADEMNKLQTTDFNAGMLYEQIDRETRKLIREYEDGMHMYLSKYHFPKIQLLPHKLCDIQEDSIIDAIKQKVNTQFNLVYGQQWELCFNTEYPSGSYYIFSYSITRKEEVKEMTIAEIEEKLGYKIKVVGE